MDNEIRSGVKLIHTMMICLKNYLFYPPDHAAAVKSAENFITVSDAFLSEYGSFRIYIEKNRLLYKGKNLLLQNVQGENLTEMLLRDGIRWIELHPGLLLSEIRGLFTIFRQYHTIAEEAEGDLVTALWEENFPHIRYEASDIFWKDEELLDFKELSCKPSVKEDAEPPGENADRKESSGGLAENPDMWMLTPAEEILLQQMVFREENPEAKKDVFDVVFIILEKEPGKEEFSAILDFTEEELRNSLMKNEFHVAAAVLKEFRRIRNDFHLQQSEFSSLLDDFLIRISGPQFLKNIPPVESGREITESGRNADSFRNYRNFLSQLHPTAIPVIAEMMTASPSSRMVHLYMQSIGNLASVDIRPFEKLLAHPDASFLHKMIQILTKLDHQKVQEHLMRLIRHPLPAVREEALKKLIRRKDMSAENIFDLIEDENPDIRKALLNFMGMKKDQKTEALFLSYLGEQRYRLKDGEHIRACFQTLGRCGSGESLPFLEEELMGKTWLHYLGQDKRNRLGAALALAELGTDAADYILDKASRSLSRSIRNACMAAMQKRNTE